MSITLLRACGAAVDAIDAEWMWAAFTAPTRADVNALSGTLQGSSSDESSDSSSGCGSSWFAKTSPLNSAYGLYRAVVDGSSMSDEALMVVREDARALVKNMLDTVESDTGMCKKDKANMCKVGTHKSNCSSLVLFDI